MANVVFSSMVIGHSNTIQTVLLTFDKYNITIIEKQVCNKSLKSEKWKNIVFYK